MAQRSSFETAIQEGLVKPLMGFAERLRQTLSGPTEEDLVATLREDCRDERRLSIQLRAHAVLMPNDPCRDVLSHIAAETEHHAQLLAEQLQALGSTLPVENGQEAAQVQPGATIWRLITADRAAIDAISQRYQAQLGWISSPQIRRLLYDLRIAKHRHMQRLSDLLSRIDSYATPEVDHGQRP